MTTATELREQVFPLKRLEELTDAFVQIEGSPIRWNVSIRPFNGGFPLVESNSDSLPEAVKQAVELWETK